MPEPLLAHLDRLLAGTDTAARLADDPLRFPRRYHDPRDQELAALFASQLAYGRVGLFGPVLERLFATFDADGGPHAFVTRLDARREAELRPLKYRFNVGDDWVRMARALQRRLAEHGTLEAVFAGDTAKEALTVGVGRLRATIGDEVSGGLGHWLASPASGSACKRWNLFLRWLVRPADGIDLGAWSRPTPAHLVVPLDTHVHRVSRFLGLTARNQADWRTAEEVTAGLRRLDPVDPVRFDFALAHLGISGACRGFRDREVCPSCPLDPVCRAD